MSPVLKEIRIVHAKFTDESQNTQSNEYKKIYFCGLCIKTYRSLREMSFMTGLIFFT